MKWIDIGGLLSDFRYYDFKRLRVKPLSVQDLLTLSTIVQSSSVLGMIDFVDDHIDQDVNELLDIDFYYVMFWLKKHSYPDSTVTVTWTCSNINVHKTDKPRELVTDPNIVKMSTPSLNYFGYDRSVCGYMNTEILYKIDTLFKEIPNRDLPIGYRYPRVATLAEAEFLKDTELYDSFLEHIRWLDYPNLAEAIEWFNVEGPADETIQIISDLMDSNDYSIKTKYHLKCNLCGTQHEVVKTPDMFRIFPLIDAKAVMDMQYNLMGQFQVSLAAETDARSFLYWHSNYVKDRRKAQEEAAKKAATRR